MGNEQSNNNILTGIAAVASAVGDGNIDKDGLNGIVQGVSKMMKDGDAGQEVWYVCPKCKQEVWAMVCSINKHIVA